MRIATIHWAFPPTIGGVETHLAILCPEQVKRGHIVFLLTGELEGEPARLVWKGVNVRRSPLMNLNNLSPRIIEEKARDIEEEIWSFIEEARPDVIHAHNLHYFSPVHARTLFKIRHDKKIPVILTAHNVWDDQLWKDMLVWREHWDRIIAVSNYIKKELVANGYPRDRIEVVYHGVDTNRFRPPAARDRKKIEKEFPHLKGRRVIFHPARMSLAKGCDISVRALPLIKEKFPDVLMVFSGTGTIVDWGGVQQKEIKLILDLADELGVRNNIFVQLFSDEQLSLMYKAADICIYPSRYQEPFGLVMLEALATAKPLIVTDSGGMPEVVQNGVTGFVVARGDHEELALRCIELLHHPAIGRSLGERGRWLVTRNFTINEMVRHTMNVYHRALQPAQRQENVWHLLAERR
ncbi:MAG: alpha-maltose-phosphate synthase [Clostridia bacterium]|nr:alpha-maltose-phosphate synthase [Clostridia bacterium]